MFRINEARKASGRSTLTSQYTTPMASLMYSADKSTLMRVAPEYGYTQTLLPGKPITSPMSHDTPRQATLPLTYTPRSLRRLTAGLSDHSYERPIGSIALLTSTDDDLEPSLPPPPLSNEFHPNHHSACTCSTRDAMSDIDTFGRQKKTIATPVDCYPKGLDVKFSWKFFSASQCKSTKSTWVNYKHYLRYSVMNLVNHKTLQTVSLNN